MPKAVDELYALLDPCTLCPRLCRARRRQGETGACGIGADLKIASVGPHFGEERPLVGTGGSGTIFLAGCNLLCVFCQNWDISHGAEGRLSSVEDLVRQMRALERRGCHNINFVSPTHLTPPIADAIVRARDAGLSVPIVYNCGGYERVETLRHLEGLVEIYMPDCKFLDADMAATYANAPDYPETVKAALAEMHRQVGDLQIRGGLARRGLLVRHLVLPGGGADSRAILDFLADAISGDTYVNVMGQYRPCFRAGDHPALARRPTHEEIAQAQAHAVARGLCVDA